MPANAPSVVFVGGGPRAAGLLERLAANRPELFDGALKIHVVEPHDPGAGRIWRYEQHPGLMLNSAAADVTMFTDTSVAVRGAGRRGPGPGRLGRRGPGRLHRGRPGAPGGTPAPAGRPHRRHLPHPAAPEPLPGMVLPPLRRRARTGRHRHRPPGHGVGRRTVQRETASGRQQAHRRPGRVPRAAGRRRGAARRRRGRLRGAHGLAAGPGVCRVGRFCRPARRVPRGAQLHHRRRLFTARRRPGRDCLRHGPGVRGPAGPADGGPGRHVRGAARRRPARTCPPVPSRGSGQVPGAACPTTPRFTSTLRGEPAGEPAFFTAEAVDGAAGSARRAGFPRPALAPDRQGCRLRRITASCSPATRSGSGLAGRNSPSVRRRRLVQPGPRSGWSPSPSRTQGCTWTSNSWTIRSRAAFSPAMRTSRQRWQRTSSSDLELRTGPDHSETLALFTSLLKFYMELGRLVPSERLNARSQRDCPGLVARVL